MNKYNSTLKFVETSFSETTRFPKTTKDFKGIYVGAYGRLYIVARGIGADSSEIISQLAVIAIKEYFDKLPDRYNAENALTAAFQKATQDVLSYIATHSWIANCNTSVALLLANQEGVFIAHSGDCKVLLLRNKKVISLTSEPSTTHEIPESVTDSDIPPLPTIPTIIGITNTEPEILSKVDVYLDDCILITTKGVYQRVTRPEIIQALSGNDLIASINLLWDVAKERKSNDDFTLIALKTIEGPPLPLDPKTIERQKSYFHWLIALAVISIIALALTLYCII